MKFDLLKLLFISLLIVGVVACGGKKEEEQAPEETPQETMEKAAEDTGDAVKEAAEDVKEAAEDAGDAVKDAAKDVKKAVTGGDYTETPMEAYVVSLNEVAAGRDGRISKSVAQSLIDKGQILGVKHYGSKDVYLVYHSNGSYAGKDLVNMAEVDKIGILGKTKTVKGVNVIMADKIRPMR